MELPNTKESLLRDLSHLGLRRGITVMVHSALGEIGWTVGGPVTVVCALLEVLGPEEIRKKYVAIKPAVYYPI